MVQVFFGGGWYNLETIYGLMQIGFVVNQHAQSQICPIVFVEAFCIEFQQNIQDSLWTTWA